MLPNKASREGGPRERRIKGVHRPQRTAVAVPMHDLDHRPRVPSRAWTRPLHGGVGGEHLMSPKEIALERIRAQPNAWPIPREMIADLVSLGHESAHKLFVSLDPPSNQKERRPGALTTQLRQNQGRGARVRAIVDRQGQEWRPGRHSVQAARIPPCEAVDEPGRGSPQRRTSGDREHSRQSESNPLRSRQVDADSPPWNGNLLECHGSFPDESGSPP